MGVLKNRRIDESLEKAGRVLDEEGAVCLEEPSGDGFTCVSTERKKIYQFTPGGTSVSGAIAGEVDYDRESSEFRVKDLDGNCRISSPIESTRDINIMMCYKDNEASFESVGDNLDEMNEEFNARLDDLDLKGLGQL